MLISTMSFLRLPCFFSVARLPLTSPVSRRPDSTASKSNGQGRNRAMIGASGGTRIRVFEPEWQQSMITCEVHARRDIVESSAQPVVRKWVFPVEICWAENLVAAIGFIAIAVGNVRAVPGVVDEQHVAPLGALYDACNAVLHGLLRGFEVG